MLSETVRAEHAALAEIEATAADASMAWTRATATRPSR
jgi:hypothetical protein